MRSTGKTIWFPAKRYGWGWGLPNCWQGWAVLAVYFLLLAIGIRILRVQHHPGLFIAYVILISIALCVTCWLKGEKPGWRWGND